MLERGLAAVAGRTIVVTGASSGIGRAVALALAPAAGRIVCLARRTDLLSEVAAEITARGGTPEVVTLDLRDTAAATATGYDLADAEVLIANAGHSIRRGVLEYADRFDTLSRSTGVNFLGSVALALPILAGMASRGNGHVIGVTSVNATLPAPGWSAYCSSKAAFDSWLRAIGPELAPANVAATAVRFPLVDTPMVRPTYGARPRGAMSVDAASAWILRALATRPAVVEPWWVRPAEALTALAPGTSARLIGRGSMRRH